MPVCTCLAQPLQPAQHCLAQHRPGQRAQPQPPAQQLRAPVGKAVAVHHHQPRHAVIVRRILVAVFGPRTDTGQHHALHPGLRLQQIDGRADIAAHLRQHAIGGTGAPAVAQSGQVQPQRRQPVFGHRPRQLHMHAVRPDAVNDAGVQEDHATRCSSSRLRQRPDQVIIRPELHQPFAVPR